MALEIEATYENGVLKLDGPLPLNDKQRVTVVVKAKISRRKRGYGLVAWSGSVEDLDYLINSEENSSLEASSLWLTFSGLLSALARNPNNALWACAEKAG